MALCGPLAVDGDAAGPPEGGDVEGTTDGDREQPVETRTAPIINDARRFMPNDKRSHAGPMAYECNREARPALADAICSAFQSLCTYVVILKSAIRIEEKPSHRVRR